MSNTGTGRILYGAMTNLRTVNEADALVRAHMPDFGAIDVPITEAAGAVLREAVYAERDQPPFDRVTMDGIAIAHSAWAAGRRSFRIQATQAAGQPAFTLEAQDACIEVMTGTALPAGSDCVVPVEELAKDGDTIRIGDAARPAPRQFVHARGSDHAQGAELLAPGMLVRGPEMAVLASAGRPTVRIARIPRVTVVAIGDELVDAGAPIAAHQIRRSNDRAITASLRMHGLTEVTSEHLPDDAMVLEHRIGAQLDAADLMILSGGVSMGRFDYVPQVLAELNVRVVFHKVAQRPGKPLWFGVGTGGQTVYALPGNPVSTLVCLARYVFAGLETSLAAASRPQESIALAERFEVKPALSVFVPVQVACTHTQRRAVPKPTRGSGDFTSLIGTDGFVELPVGPATLAAGTPVALYSW